MRYSGKSIRTLLLLVILHLPQTAFPGEELVLGIHPFKHTTDLLSSFSPLTEYLSNAIGQSIRIEIARDYQSHIKAVGENRMDIAYLGPVLYVSLLEEYGPRPILAQLEVNKNNTFRGVIIINKNSKLNKLADLEGKQFAFGDPNSTMSHIVPQVMLHEAGVEKKELAEFEHLPNHAAVALGVLSGMYDAGAIKENIFNKYKSRGLKALAWTPRICEHVFVTRTDLPKTTVTKIQVAINKLTADTYGSLILHAIKPTVTALRTDKGCNFNNLRTMLRTLNEINGDTND